MGHPRSRQSDPATIARWIREGRGQGEGAEYKPWLTVRDVPSTGLCWRVKNWKCGGRVCHYLSTLETNLSLFLDWHADTITFFEQFPLLPLDETIEIATRLGVRPPTDPHNQMPVVMTSDFLVRTTRGLVAYAVKPTSALSSRSQQKLQIEMEYWKERGIPWGIVTEKSMPKALLSTLQQVHAYHSLDFYPHLTGETIHLVINELDPLLRAELPIAEAARVTDKRLKLQKGSALVVLLHCIARRLVTFDPHNPLNLSEPLCLPKSNY